MLRARSSLDVMGRTYNRLDSHTSPHTYTRVHKVASAHLHAANIKIDRRPARGVGRTPRRGCERRVQVPHEVPGHRIRPP